MRRKLEGNLAMFCLCCQGAASWSVQSSVESDMDVMRWVSYGHFITYQTLIKLIEQDIEDTSDEYYHLLHRKYEVFERRQRIREKEKLQFERYKMRSRIDLLKGMSKSGWSSIVTAVLSRFPSLSKTHSQRISGEADIGTKKLEDDGESQVDIWRKGREKIQVEGIDWLREKLVKEGEDLLKRYDQLLPIETRR